MKMNLYGLIVLVSAALVCHGRGKYRDLIPNGRNVPNPCTANETDTWPRVGHVIQDFRKDSKREKTSFGKDFMAAKKKSEIDGTGQDGIWIILCSKDSDGDGMTNGQELGDASCLWRKSTNDASFNKLPRDLFHPGIPEQANGTLTDTNRNKFCPK